MKQMVVLIIAVVFVITSTLGFAQNRDEYKKLDKVLHKMKLELELTPRQVEDIRLIMEDAISKRIDLKKAEEEEGASKSLTAGKRAKIRHEEADAITAVLTPKQLKLRADLEKKKKEEQQKKLKEKAKQK